jgi:hypothetical protein
MSLSTEAKLSRRTSASFKSSSRTVIFNESNLKKNKKKKIREMQQFDVKLLLISRKKSIIARTNKFNK